MIVLLYFFLITSSAYLLIITVKMLRRISCCFLDNMQTVMEQPPHALPNDVPNNSMPFSWLSSMAPRFPVKPENIEIFSEPTDFYATLQAGCHLARRRITWSSLYFGTGQHEWDLVSTILSNQYFQNGNLKVRILIDYARGSRPSNDSRTVLLPLLQTAHNIQKNVHVSLYHTPELRGWRRTLIPHRINEIFGLQHMKVYIFDDLLIVSGANLSKDYFVNRQDRYYLIRDKSLCDFYCELIECVQKFSFQMQKDNQLKMDSEWKHYLPYKCDKMEFIKKASQLVKSFIEDAMVASEKKCATQENCDTYVYPLIQMGNLGIFQDSVVTERLLREAPHSSYIWFSSGYFNLTSQYANTITQNSLAHYDILMAHPEANGFYGASGLSGFIPDAYSLIARQFNDQIIANQQSDRIKLWEYYRKNWTFHAKGLWYRAPGALEPCLTLIGSPNFGSRSVYKDLETQIVITTDNHVLQRKLGEEWRRLADHSNVVTFDRPITKWLGLLVNFFKHYL